MTANFQFNDIFTSGNITSSGIITGTSGVFNYLIANTGTLDIIQFNTNNGSVASQGQMGWNSTEGTVDIALTNSGVMEIGQHRFFRVRNTTGSPLYKGQVVYASGVHSNGIITPNLYIANNTIDEIRFIGLIFDTINHNNNGYVVDFGHLRDLNLDGSATNYAVGDESWLDGDILYAHPTVAGKLTKIKPKHAISLAIILDNGGANGQLFVRPTNFGDLSYNHDVNISGVTNGQFLQYDSATDYWVASSSGNFSSLIISNNATVSGLLTASGINIGATAQTGIISGLSTSATVPAIRFQSVTANHTNTSHTIFDFYKNISTRLLYIDGAGNTTIDATNGNLIVPSTGPSTGNGSLIAHGMRRATTTAGMDFAWGESITSASEPGIDLFPIGGTHMVSGILFRLSKNSTKSDVAMLINGSGNVGIGTSAPNAPLHIVGNTNISGVLTATSGSITTLNTVPTFTSPSALGSSQGDWNPGAGDVIRASASVSGVAISGIFLGNEYTRVLINVGTTNNLTLKHQASTATSGYRIITPNGGDYIVQPTGAATILYDIVDNRWRVL